MREYDDPAEEEVGADLVGLDVTEDANVPRALCADCLLPGDEGESICRGDEWGGYECHCHRCGAHIDVTLVWPGDVR